MRILPVSQKITSELRKVESAKKNEQASSKRMARATDRSEFSPGAKRLSETKANAEIVSAQLENQPDIRTEKVEEARQKVKSGYYDSPQFLDKLVDKLIVDFGLGETK
jgi:anti-sigma28 factor (negative regulator of flagellin synthesis)